MEQKTRSAVLCKRAGVQEAVQILGLKFSSEDEKSGSAKLPGSKKRAVLCRSAGGSANFRFKVFKWRWKVRQSYLGAKSAQCSTVQFRREREAPASCSCLHRSLISTFQNAILWNTTNTYSKIRKYRRNIAHCSYSIAETALMTRPSNFWFTTRNKTQSKQKQNRASTPTS